MKTIIIANPQAGAGKVGKRWSQYNRAIIACFGPAQVRFTAGCGDATLLARRAVREGFERIAVVGGDGTLNEAVNGLFSEDGTQFLGKEVSIVLYPAGTGGDFARSIGLADGAGVKLLESASDRRIDLGRAQMTLAGGRPLCRYFINISSFGASGLVVDRVNKTTKIFGGRASFMLGTVHGLLTYKNQRVRLQVDDSFDEEVLINTVAVANGRYFGGAMKIAPEALLEDGALDVIVIGNIGLSTFLRYSGHLYKGRHLALPEVRALRGRVVTATPLSSTPILIDLDGEQPGQLPVRYDVLPKHLKLYAPWEQAEVASHMSYPADERIDI